MPKYRKKPVVIQAFKIGKEGEPTPVPDWFVPRTPDQITPDGVVIPTLEGNMLARWGDYVIQGVQGEQYPCKPEIFEATYELVEE